MGGGAERKRGFTRDPGGWRLICYQNSALLAGVVTTRVNLAAGQSGSELADCGARGSWYWGLENSLSFRAIPENQVAGCPLRRHSKGRGDSGLTLWKHLSQVVCPVSCYRYSLSMFKKTAIKKANICWLPTGIYLKQNQKPCNSWYFMFNIWKVMVTQNSTIIKKYSEII